MSAAVLFVVMLATGLSVRRYIHKRMPAYVMNMIETNPDYFSQGGIYTADEWELNR